MLIYINKPEISKEKRNIAIATERLNAFYKQAETLLGKLSKEELNKLPTQGRSVVMDNLRKRYNFENASDKFNLEALGIDPNKTIEAYKTSVKSWSKYNFIYSNDGYNVDNEQKYLEKQYTYADTKEKQNLVAMYESLATSFNMLAETGMALNIPSFLDALPNVFKGISVGGAISKYITIDNERLANHLNTLGSYRNIPLRETSKEAFERLDIQPLNNTLNNG